MQWNEVYRNTVIGGKTGREDTTHLNWTILNLLLKTYPKGAPKIKNQNWQQETFPTPAASVFALQGGGCLRVTDRRSRRRSNTSNLDPNPEHTYGHQFRSQCQKGTEKSSDSSKRRTESETAGERSLGGVSDGCWNGRGVLLLHYSEGWIWWRHQRGWV